jgi:hypothetical protein
MADDQAVTAEHPPERKLTPEEAAAKAKLQAELARDAERRTVAPFAGAAGVRAIIRTPTSQRITPARHVQACADALQAATGVTSFGTYLGHSPTPERAIDIFVPVSPTTAGDRAAQWLLDNWDRHGMRYLIWRQRINWNDGAGWAWMADRGSVTANHYDHLHAAFEESAPEPEPTPQPVPKEEPEVSKVAYPLEVAAGETRKLPIVAIGCGFGWTKAAVTFASTGVKVRRAIVGPNERRVEGLAPADVQSFRSFDGRGYVDLQPGDEWLLVELDPQPAGTLDLYVEASDG